MLIISVMQETSNCSCVFIYPLYVCSSASVTTAIMWSLPLSNLAVRWQTRGQVVHSCLARANHDVQPADWLKVLECRSQDTIRTGPLVSVALISQLETHAGTSEPAVLKALIAALLLHCCCVLKTTRLPKDYLITFPHTSTTRAQSELTCRAWGCWTGLQCILIFVYSCQKHLTEILILSKNVWGRSPGIFTEGNLHPGSDSAALDHAWRFIYYVTV